MSFLITSLLCSCPGLSSFPILPVLKPCKNPARCMCILDCFKDEEVEAQVGHMNLPTAGQGVSHAFPLRKLVHLSGPDWWADGVGVDVTASGSFPVCRAMSPPYRQAHPGASRGGDHVAQILCVTRQPFPSAAFPPCCFCPIWYLQAGMAPESTPKVILENKAVWGDLQGHLIFFSENPVPQSPGLFFWGC